MVGQGRRIFSFFVRSRKCPVFQDAGGEGVRLGEIRALA
jgi:hypothetical protein